MSSPLSNYPLPPTNVDESIIDVTPAFKAQVLKVTLSILFFLFSYIALLGLAICLAVAAAWLGYAMVVGYPQFFTLMLGGGLVGFGLLIIYFLLKFLFKRHKIDLSNLVEITEEDEPVLFEFIKKVSDETQAQFPKKIYISDDVNASVFYESSFLSMFLPVKKNLRIGLGMVNVINISEFKAIIAHEFGHFSQRSMKFGSYVYYVNNMIYNMLYDNENYSEIVNRFARVSSYFGLFAVLTLKITKGIQWLLKQIYVVVNRAYSSLSIEMEYHADTVSAYVTGSQHLITSLKKMEIAQICYTDVLNYCNQTITDNLKSDNFYAQHNVVIQKFADSFNIPMHGDKLAIAEDTRLFLNQSRIVIKDQWASHPSNADRESKLKALNIQTDALPVSAWTLFANPENLQAELTNKVYETVNFKAKPTVLDLEMFSSGFNRKFKENNFDPEYKGYYDSRIIREFNPADVIKNDNDLLQLTMAELFTDVNCALPGKINALKNDVETLKQIGQKSNNIKSFDFDGIKYSYKDALHLQQQLENDTIKAEDELNNIDKKMFGYFYNQMDTDNKDRLKEAYHLMFKTERETQTDFALYNEVMATIRPIYNNMKFTEIRLTLQDVKLKENKIIPRLQHILDQSEAYALTELQEKCLKDYLKHNKIYFLKPNFDNNAISVFNNAMNVYASVVMERSFKVKKQTLNLQLNKNN